MDEEGLEEGNKWSKGTNEAKQKNAEQARNQTNELNPMNTTDPFWDRIKKTSYSQEQKYNFLKKDGN